MPVYSNRSRDESFFMLLRINKSFDAVFLSQKVAKWCFIFNLLILHDSAY
jgi:hypothetical protein